MSEISDLKQRVEAVGAKFGRLAEQESSYGERLTDLLTAVEEGFARSQRETQKLNSDLESAQEEVKKLTGELDAAKEETRQRNRELDGAKEEREKLSSELDGAKKEREKLSSEVDGAREESKQLRGMVQTLLEAVESGENLDLGDAMRNLESRIDRIVTSTDDHDADLGAKPAAAPKEPAIETPEPAETIPAEATPAAEEPSAEEPSAEETESAKEGTLVLASGAEPSVEAEPPAPAETDKDEAGPEDVVASAAEPEDEAAEPPSDDDLSAVNKIIQRISLLTGEFVEPSQKKSDETEEKPIPSLKVGNGADDAPGAGSRKSKASSKDEAAAKTT